jgi:cytochrome P450
VNELDDLLTSAEYARNPHPGNHRLRAEDPVHWSDAWEMWVPTRYKDIRRILDDVERFSSTETSATRIRRLLERVVPEPERSELLEFWEMGGLFQSDPPEYRRYRSLMMKALAPRLRGIETRVQAILDEILDPLLGLGHIDLVRDVAYPLPATVIFDLLGVDKDHRPAFRRWTSSLVMAVADQSGQAAIQSAKDLREAYAWLADVVKERRRSPHDDVISIIVNSEEFATMSHRDLLGTIVFLLLAGHETTANLIASGMFQLLQDRSKLEALRADPTLMGTAIEEFLRHESPIQTTARRTLVDVELDGQVIRAGQIVAIMHGAANRDPARFPDPDVCDIRRTPNPHLAFGHGVHFCVGAPLARLEGPIAIRTLIDRLAEAEIDGACTWRANTTFRGLEALPVGFRPDAGRLPSSISS